MRYYFGDCGLTHFGLPLQAWLCVQVHNTSAVRVPAPYSCFQSHSHRTYDVSGPHSLQTPELYLACCMSHMYMKRTLKSVRVHTVWLPMCCTDPMARGCGGDIRVCHCITVSVSGVGV